MTQFLGNRTGEGQFEAAMLLYKDQDYTSVYDLSPVLDVTTRWGCLFVDEASRSSV